MTFYIRKSSGEKQRFDLDKFRRSLFKAGAQEQEVDYVVSQIMKERPKSTQTLYQRAMSLLQKRSPTIANRYNLKRALMELGPDGYPFEKFVAQLLKEMGYTVSTNAIVPGACVHHEVDVIAQKDTTHSLIECKFHNRPGLKSDVKVTLYMQARFEDVREQWQKNPQDASHFHEVWVVTNTQFTSEAITYATCRGIRLVGWGYPEQDNIAQLIERYRLFPVSTISSLSRKQKQQLLKHGIVLCRNVREQKNELQKLGFNPAAIEKIIAESEAVCALPLKNERRNQ